MDRPKTRSMVRSGGNVKSSQMTASPYRSKISKIYPKLPKNDDDYDDDLSGSGSSDELEYSKSSHFKTSSSDYADSSYFKSPSPAASHRPPLHPGSASSGSKIPYSPTDSPYVFEGGAQNVRHQKRKAHNDANNSFGASSTDDFHSSCDLSPKPSKCGHRKSPTLVDNSYIWIGMILVIVVGIGVYFVIFGGNSNKLDKPPDLFDTFKEYLGSLQSKFPSQDSKSWKILRTSIKHILTEPEPIHPAVVLMVGQRSSLPVMKCVARKLVRILNTLHNISQTEESRSEIRVEELNHRSPAAEKLDLDQRLHATLNSGHKGALLVNLQILSPDAALMLHSYCDNDNAPYKNVLLVLQLVQDDLDPKMLDVPSVENHLQNLWEGDLGIDRVKALFSRIANNVVFMQPEQDTLLAKECD